MNKILLSASLMLASVPAIMHADSLDVSAGTAQVKLTASGKLQMNGTGAMIAMELKTLHEAAQKLTLEQRIELTKMIRTYIESKGVVIPALPQMKAVRQEIKEIKKEAKTEIKTIREKAKTEIKTKRGEMKLKVEGGSDSIEISTGASGVVVTGM